MPLDWENRVITRRPDMKTRFTSVKIEDPTTVQKFFGKYTQSGETILVCEPERSSCAPYIIVPQGTIALLFSSGAFEAYAPPGLLFCLPWTETKYLVSEQDFVYDSPKNRVITKDNINVDISLSILLCINKESDYVQQLVTNVSQINELLDANIMERVRGMARAVKANEAYSLRGEEHAKGMIEHLNLNMAKNGVKIKRCIITNVILDKEVSNSMQEKTIYQFKNTLERKQFAYNQRIKNDAEEENKARQIKQEERKDEEKKASLAQMTKNQEIQNLKAKTARIKSEWAAKTEALINGINAETDLKYNEIVAEANLIESKIVQEAEAQAAEIKARADAYKVTTIANTQQEVAPLIAQAVELEGEAEKQLQKAFAMKRTHDQIMSKVSAVGSLAANKNTVIVGTQNNNLLAQVETYKQVQKS